MKDKSNLAGASAASTATTKEQKKEARERKRKARLEAKKAAAQVSTPKAEPVKPLQEEQGPVAAALALAAVPPSTTNKLHLPADLREKIALLLPAAAEPICLSLAQEVAPSAPEANNPEAIMAKYIGEKGPTAKSQKKGELEATIIKWKATIATLQDGGEPVAAVLADVRAKLEADEAALAKLAKDAPSQEHERMAVAGAKTAYETYVQARRDREARGAAKSKERQALRMQHIADLKQQIVLLEKGVVQIATENSTKHMKSAEAAAAVDAQVLALFDQKLASLTDSAAMTDAPVINAGSSNYTLSHVRALEAAAKVEVPAATLQELETLKQTNARLMELVQSSCNKIKEIFEKSYDDIQPEHLPVPSVTEPNTLIACAGLYNTLQSWAFSGAPTPFEWRALGQAAGGDSDIFTLGKYLLGDVWDRWYVDNPPNLDTVVPRQVGLLIYHCLSLVKKDFEKEDSRDEESRAKVSKFAREGLEAVRASAKRLRLAE